MKHYEQYSVANHVYKRHWCPRSETFTGADSLLCALDRGWHIRRVDVAQSDRNTDQTVTLYAFTLQRGPSTTVMRVVASPYARRLAERFQTGKDARRPNRVAATTS